MSENGSVSTADRVISTVLGSVLVACGLLFNPWFVSATLRTVGIELIPAFYMCLVLGQLLSICLGIYFMTHLRYVRQHVGSLLLFVVTLLLSVALLNLLLSIARPDSLMGELSKDFYVIYEPHATGFRYPGRDDEFAKVPIETNSLSMRGPEIPEKAPDEKRILILGDSFIQADEVPFGDTVGQVLQAKLSSWHTILQQGYAGWSPLVELNFLLKNYEALEPDGVILFLFVNDFYDASVGWSDAAYLPITNRDARGYPQSFKVSEPASLSIVKVKLVKTGLRVFRKRPRCTEYYTLDRLTEIMTSTASKKERLTELNGLAFLENILRLSLEEVDWDASTAHTVDSTFNSVLLMKKFLEQRGATLQLVLIPSGWNIDGDELSVGKQMPHFCMDRALTFGDSKIRQYIARKSVEHNIEYVEILDGLKEQKERRGGALYLKADGHWNANAHAIVADILYRNMTE